MYGKRTTMTLSVVFVMAATATAQNERYDRENARSNIPQDKDPRAPTGPSAGTFEESVAAADISGAKTATQLRAGELRADDNLYRIPVDGNHFPKEFGVVQFSYQPDIAQPYAGDVVRILGVGKPVGSLQEIAAQLGVPPSRRAAVREIIMLIDFRSNGKSILTEEMLYTKPTPVMFSVQVQGPTNIDQQLVKADLIFDPTSGVQRPRARNDGERPRRFDPLHDALLEPIETKSSCIEITHIEGMVVQKSSGRIVYSTPLSHGSPTRAVTVRRCDLANLDVVEMPAGSGSVTAAVYPTSRGEAP